LAAGEASYSRRVTLCAVCSAVQCSAGQRVGAHVGTRAYRLGAHFAAPARVQKSAAVRPRSSSSSSLSLCVTLLSMTNSMPGAKDSRTSRIALVLVVMPCAHRSTVISNRCCTSPSPGWIAHNLSGSARPRTRPLARPRVIAGSRRHGMQSPGVGPWCCWSVCRRGAAVHTVQCPRPITFERPAVRCHVHMHRFWFEHAIQEPHALVAHARRPGSPAPPSAPCAAGRASGV